MAIGKPLDARWVLGRWHFWLGTLSHAAPPLPPPPVPMPAAELSGSHTANAGARTSAQAPTSRSRRAVRPAESGLIVLRFRHPLNRHRSSPNGLVGASALWLKIGPQRSKNPAAGPLVYEYGRGSIDRSWLWPEQYTWLLRTRSGSVEGLSRHRRRPGTTSSAARFLCTDYLHA